LAGAIFISKELRLPVSTRDFDYLAERIRLAFDTEGQAFLREIYSPADDAGMYIISAEYGGEAGLHAFFRAVLRASQENSGEPDYEVYARFWNDLLTLIRLDPRFSSEWQKSDVAS
jgi:hypothetical protein